MLTLFDFSYILYWDVAAKKPLGKFPSKKLQTPATLCGGQLPVVSTYGEKLRNDLLKNIDSLKAGVPKLLPKHLVATCTTTLLGSNGDVCGRLSSQRIAPPERKACPYHKIYAVSKNHQRAFPSACECDTAIYMITHSFLHEGSEICVSTYFLNIIVWNILQQVQ